MVTPLLRRRRVSGNGCRPGRKTTMPIKVWRHPAASCCRLGNAIINPDTKRVCHDGSEDIRRDLRL